MVFGRNITNMSDAVISSFNGAGLCLYHQQYRLEREHQRDEYSWDDEEWEDNGND